MERLSESQSTTNQTKNGKRPIGTVKKGEAAPTAPVFLRVSRKVSANRAVRESVVQRRMGITDNSLRLSFFRKLLNLSTHAILQSPHGPTMA
jgi:hypothetical protein